MELNGILETATLQLACHN